MIPMETTVGSSSIAKKYWKRKLALLDLMVSSKTVLNHVYGVVDPRNIFQYL